MYMLKQKSIEMIIREATKNDSGAIANVVLLAIGVDIEHLEQHTSPFNYELVKTLASTVVKTFASEW